MFNDEIQDSEKLEELAFKAMNAPGLDIDEYIDRLLFISCNHDHGWHYGY